MEQWICRRLKKRSDTRLAAEADSAADAAGIEATNPAAKAAGTGGLGQPNIVFGQSNPSFGQSELLMPDPESNFVAVKRTGRKVIKLCFAGCG